MISLHIFFALKNILVLLAKPDSGELRYPATTLIILASNEDMHKISVKFDFRPNQTTHFGVTMYLPLSDENFKLLNLNISEASWPILIKFNV